MNASRETRKELSVIFPTLANLEANDLY